MTQSEGELAVAELHFVRGQHLAPQPPPLAMRGALGWLRENLLSTPFNIALTIIIALLLAWAIPELVKFLLLDAVWTGADRPLAAHALLAAHPDRDLIIADDGLQHYALARDIEIAVIDASRGLGNGLPLPAGPLREPAARLGAVDAIVHLGGTGDSRREFAMTLTGDRFVRVGDDSISTDAALFRTGEVHAIAGIGDPGRFFAQLAALGISALCHPVPDHHRYVAADLALPGATAILMTEKDAVKCRRFADDRCWAWPVSATVEPALIALVERGLRGRKTA